MTHHIHVLATPDSGRAISKVFQSVGRRYVHYFNVAYGRGGTLVVSRECAAGDPNAAKKWLDAIEGLTLLRTTKEAVELSKTMVARGIIPSKAAEDSLHISIATIHAMDFLLTWNCKHIANPEIQRKIALYLEKQGLFLPFICTPEELLGADDE